MAIRPYTKDRQVQTTLTTAQVELLDRVALERQCSRADLIRRVVLEALAEEEIERAQR